MSDSDCIFCKIVSGELPSCKVYEDDETAAFMDVGPIVKGHVLVIPKLHYANIFETPVALLQTVLVGGVNLAFTVLAIWIVDRVGRKPLMIIGAAGMGLCLAAIGVAAYTQVIGAWLLIFMLGYIACFAMSVGPVTWVILSEIFPTKIRGRALAIATFCLWVANFIVSQTFPMMDGNPWLVKHFNHGFPFLIYAGFCVVLVIVMARLVPETKGRTLEELEQIWKK